MMTFRKIALALLFVCSLPLYGEQYKYVKGYNTYYVSENSQEYLVESVRTGGQATSGNKNITDRQTRMDATDLIGAYILYKSTDYFKSLGPDYFQIYVDGANLHYNAYLEGMSQEEKHSGGQFILVFRCKKENYIIQSATFSKIEDFSALIGAYYGNNRGEEASNLVYNYKGFSSAQLINMEHDFLTGDAKLPYGVRKLQGINDRFEVSVYGDTDGQLKELLCEARQKKGDISKPYSQFWLEEIITSISLKDKLDAYSQWTKELSPKHTAYENILLFCAQNCSAKLKDLQNANISDVIEAFPGAISPFGIRQPIDDNTYNKAAKAYSESKFEEAAELLREVIDNEGISPKVLNLLGASYRFLGRYDKALPYLLLCLKLNPKTQYLAGNIILCLKGLNFCDIAEIRSFLSPYVVDEWSGKEIK